LDRLDWCIEVVGPDINLFRWSEYEIYAKLKGNMVNQMDADRLNIGQNMYNLERYNSESKG
jgi:hypothetical protein